MNCPNCKQPINTHHFSYGQIGGANQAGCTLTPQDIANHALKEVLTKVYGLSNRLKVDLALKDDQGAWNTLNELNDYLVSIEITPFEPPPGIAEIPGPIEKIAKAIAIAHGIPSKYLKHTK